MSTISLSTHLSVQSFAMAPNTLISLLGLVPACLAALKPEFHPGQPRQLSSNARIAPAAIPTPNLKADFKKNNVTASWAPGYPKVWAQADKKFSIPYESIPRNDAAFSQDGKFLLLTNETDTVVFKVDTGALVSSFKNQYYQFWAPYDSIISPVSGGQSDFLLAAQNFTQNGPVSRITQQRISADGFPVGPVVDRAGYFASYSPPLAIDGDGKRILFAVADNNDVFIYNLDDANSTAITLKGHIDSVLSAVLSPDKKAVATTGFVSTTTYRSKTNH